MNDEELEDHYQRAVNDYLSSSLWDHRPVGRRRGDISEQARKDRSEISAAAMQLITAIDTYLDTDTANPRGRLVDIKIKIYRRDSEVDSVLRRLNRNLNTR